MESFKKFYIKAIEWKTWAALFFTGTLIVYMIISFFMGEDSISLINILGLLLISAVGTFIQFLFFTDNIIKKMKYSLRTLLFGICFGVFLTISAVVLQWFPANKAGAWISFMAIFILIFVVFSVLFEIYFNLTGRKYDGFLGQYKKDREEKNK